VKRRPSWSDEPGREVEQPRSAQIADSAFISVALLELGSAGDDFADEFGDRQVRGMDGENLGENHALVSEVLIAVRAAGRPTIRRVSVSHEEALSPCGQALGWRSCAAGGRFLEPVASYRSRCIRPSSTFAGCHGAGVASARPHLCLSAQGISSDKSIVQPRTPQDPEVQATLGRVIRELRNKQGRSQGALAEEAGITRNMLSLIERGEGNPSWSTFRGIAKALGISASELAKLAEGGEGDSTF